MQRRVEAHEEWRPIADWPGYEVSSMGRVRSWKQRTKGRTWKPDYSQPPRILRPAPRNGYLSIVLIDPAKGKRAAGIHRLVLETFVGPSSLHGAHNNGDKRDNQLSNLRWATPSENNADKVRHGTFQHGERIGSAKLTEANVARIRSLRAGGARVKDLAVEFGVCRNTITNIAQGHQWQGVRDAAE